MNSWTENRKTDWKSEPYPGGYVDGEYNGQPPAPWEIPVSLPEPFSEKKYEIRKGKNFSNFH